MRTTGLGCPSTPESKTACSSNDEPFTQIWLQHRAEMLGLCRKCTRQEADAEEAFSRASLLLYRKLPDYHERIENLRGWILRLTFNTCMSLHRESRRRGEQSLEEAVVESLADSSFVDTSPTGDPESSYLRKEMSQFLRRSIENLPERLRATMLGHLSLDGYREIAARLSINEANARKRMQEAREALSRGLEQYRAGTARPSTPRHPKSPGPASGGQAAGEPSERVQALRAVRATLPTGAEVEGLLALRIPLGKERRQALESYLEQHPRSAAKRLALARVLLEEGRVEAALPHLEHGVERQPRHLEAWLDLIAIYRLQDRLQDRPSAAAGACGRAIAANPGPAAVLLHGLRAQCLDHEEEAKRAFLTALKAMPESPVAWTALAELELAVGRPREAADFLEGALARSPTDVTALTLGSEALRLLGRFAEARRRDARALELDGTNPLALERHLAASARKAGGRLAPQGDLWRAVESLAPTRSAALSLLGFLRVCNGDLAGPGEIYARVAERPRLSEARIERARLLDALGRSLAAIQEIDVARTLQPDSRELDLLACRVAIRAGLPKRALQESEGLLACHGEAWDTASTAAWALAHLGHMDQAMELSRAAVKHQPDLPAAWLEHGRVLARAERLREAAAATEKGWSLLPKDDGFDLAVPAALDLAVTYGRLDYPEWAHPWALQALESCAALAEFDPVRAHIFRIWIQEEAGPKAGASTTESVEIAPSFLRIEERRLLTNQLSEASLG